MKVCPAKHDDSHLPACKAKEFSLTLPASPVVFLLTFFCQEKNGLLSISFLMLVSGPWPGYTTVS